MLKKLDSYILSEFGLPFTSGAGILTGVWLGVDKFKEVLKLLASSGAPISTGFVILGLEIPHIFSMTLPISILLAAFLTFQKLSSQSELIAMRAGGISFLRIMKSVIIFGLLGAVSLFIITELIVPFATPLAKQFYTISLYSDPIVKDSNESFSYFEKNSDGELRRIFHVKSIDNEVLKNPIIVDFSEKNMMIFHTAETGIWKPEKGGWLLLEGKSTILKKPKSHQADQDPSSLISNFDSALIPSSIDPQEVLQNMTKVQYFNFHHLLNTIQETEANDPYNRGLTNMKVVFHNKFAYPVSCIFLAVIGACLGLTSRRQAYNWGYIGLGVVVFIFYMSQSMLVSMKPDSMFSPLVSVWLPNLILLAISFAVFLYKTRR